MTGRTTGAGGIWIPSPVRSDVWTGLPWPGMENVGIREREVDNGRSRTPQSLVSGKVTMSFDGVVDVFWCVCVCVCFRVSADKTIHHRALHSVIIPVVPVLGGC